MRYYLPFYLAWGAFWVYWVYESRSDKTSVRVESSGTRYVYLSALVIAIALLIADAFEPLDVRILPASDLYFALGFLVTVAGLVFAVWARVHLGQYWSAAVAIKQDHKIIRTGPYASVRHPIYTGYLVGILGSAIAIGELRGAIAVIFAVFAFYYKSRLEEAWLTQEFGQEYEDYRRDVKALIPFIL